MFLGNSCVWMNTIDDIINQIINFVRRSSRYSVVKMNIGFPFNGLIDIYIDKTPQFINYIYRKWTEYG